MDMFWSEAAIALSAHMWPQSTLNMYSSTCCGKVNSYVIKRGINVILICIAKHGITEP